MPVDLRNIQWHPKARKWMVRITVNGKVLYGGLHEHLVDAIDTADELRAHAATLRRNKRLGLPCVP
jgi:uncharacterized protein (UPF0248 family)